MIGSRYQLTLELLSIMEPEELPLRPEEDFEVPICYRCVKQISDLTFLRFKVEGSVFDFHKNCYYLTRRIKSLRSHPI